MIVEKDGEGMKEKNMEMNQKIGCTILSSFALIKMANKLNILLGLIDIPTNGDCFTINSRDCLPNVNGN